MKILGFLFLLTSWNILACDFISNPEFLLDKGALRVKNIPKIEGINFKVQRAKLDNATSCSDISLLTISFVKSGSIHPIKADFGYKFKVLKTSLSHNMIPEHPLIPKSFNHIVSYDTVGFTFPWVERDNTVTFQMTLEITPINKVGKLGETVTLNIKH